MACILTSFHKNDIVGRGKDQQHNFVNILYILIHPSVNKTFSLQKIPFLQTVVDLILDE